MEHPGGLLSSTFLRKTCNVVVSYRDLVALMYNVWNGLLYIYKSMAHWVHGDRMP